MDLGLEHARVLVTGASQGIGAGVADAFAAEGCRLVVTARSAENLAEVASNLRQKYRTDVQTMPVDLTDPQALGRIADLGDVDVVVNNAGNIPGGGIDRVDDAQWRRGWDLKVFGYINLCRHFYAAMTARRSGVIVNNIGASANYLDPHYIAGSTGNAALVALTRALGSTSLDHGVRVVGVNPGPVATDRIARLLDQRSVGDEAPPFPLGRPASVGEIADSIVFLASARSAYTSGVVLDIDGGLSARHGF